MNRELDFEMAEAFVAYIATFGYSIIFTMFTCERDRINKTSIKIDNPYGEALVVHESESDVGITQQICGAVNSFIRTNDGQEMIGLWGE